MHRLSYRKLILSVFLAIALPLCATATSLELWPANHPPPDSPYWWTLSDDISPADLRDLLLDTSDHRRHYLQAVEKGHAEALPPNRLEKLNYFVSGRMTPERFRASPVFDMFLVAKLKGTEPIDEIAWELSKYQITQDGIAAILDIGDTALDERQARVDSTAVQAHEFLDLLKQAERDLPSTSYKKLLRSRDLSTLAKTVGRPESEVVALATEWERDAAEEVAMSSLQILKDTLGLSDWNHFRRFLLSEIAAKMVTSSFQEEE